MAKNSAVISVLVTGDTKQFRNALDDGEKATESFNKSVDKASKGFDGLRDGADDTERRIIGFKDSLTGTKDLTQGFAEGNLEMMAQGFADLASSVANLGADLLEWGKKGVQAIGNVTKATITNAAATVKQTAATVASKTAQLAAAAASKAWAAAQWVLNTALAANPIGLVVIAIAALVAAFVLAWKNSETFREIVTGAFDAVRGVVEGVFNWVKDNWPLLLAILTGPIGLAVLGITRHWDSIKSGFTAVKDWIGNRIDDVVGFFTGMPGRLKSAAGDLFGFVKENFKAAINAVISLWNGVRFPEFSMGGWDPPGPGPKLPTVTIGGWSLPQIPYLASGGIATRPTLAMIGEGGNDEAVIPLPRGWRTGGMSGGLTIVVQGNVYGVDHLDRVVKESIQRAQRRGL